MIVCCCCYHKGMFCTSLNGGFEIHIKGCECFWRECLAEGERWEGEVIVDIVDIVVTVSVAIDMNVVATAVVDVVDVIDVVKWW